LTAEYELRLPLSHAPQGQLMDELDQRIDRDLLDLYLRAAAEVDPGRRPVDNSCTPTEGLPSSRGTTSSSSSRSADKSPRTCTEEEPVPRSTSECAASPRTERPRTLARGFALARRLQARVAAWRALPVAVLAAELDGLAARGWSAWRTDRAVAAVRGDLIPRESRPQREAHDRRLSLIAALRLVAWRTSSAEDSGFRNLEVMRKRLAEARVARLAGDPANNPEYADARARLAVQANTAQSAAPSSVDPRAEQALDPTREPDLVPTNDVTRPCDPQDLESERIRLRALLRARAERRRRS
jgi:hypothetical protein